MNHKILEFIKPIDIPNRLRRHLLSPIDSSIVYTANTTQALGHRKHTVPDTDGTWHYTIKVSCDQ